MLNPLRRRPKTPSPASGEGRREGAYPNVASAFRWFTLIAVAALAATVLTLSAIPSGPAAPPVAAQAPCTAFAIDQEEDETAAGSTIDLTLVFDGCTYPNESLTITLPGEMGISGFDRDEDVIITAVGQRYSTAFVNLSTADDGSHEIEVPGCANWRDYSDNPPGEDCNTTLSNIRITLRTLRLPSKPEPDGDPYQVSAQWGSNDPLLADLTVNPALQVSDDGETVRYGETLTSTGAGFNDGLDARLYASQPSSTASDCKSGTISGWRQIATANIGGNYRFTTDLTIEQGQFPTAGTYQICARDGAGLASAKPVTITVAAGVALAGSREVSPGDDVLLRLVGNPGSVQTVTVGGVEATIKSQSGSTLTVTMPPRVTGIATIRVTFADGSSAFVNVTVADATLTISGVHGDGIGLGETAFVSAFDLPGEEVCTVTLGGVPIALLDDRRDIPDDGCIEIRRGGRFNATVLVADPHGDLTAQVIGKNCNPRYRRQAQAGGNRRHRRQGFRLRSRRRPRHYL